MTGHTAAILVLSNLQVYNVDSKQDDVYNSTARPIVDAVLNGYNGAKCSLKCLHCLEASRAQDHAG